MRNYTRIRLITNRYKLSENLPKGSVGYIIETYENGEYEVEFSDIHGITVSQLVLSASEIESAELVEYEMSGQIAV